MTLLELLSQQPFNVNVTAYYYAAVRVRNKVDIRVDTWLEVYRHTKQLRDIT